MESGTYTHTHTHTFTHQESLFFSNILSVFLLGFCFFVAECKRGLCCCPFCFFFTFKIILLLLTAAERHHSLYSLDNIFNTIDGVVSFVQR